jgi:hypothetical protein
MRERRIRRAAAIAATIGSLAVVSALPAQAITAGAATPRDDRPGPCPLTRVDGEAIQDFSRRMIACAAERWPVPGGAEKAICIADRESGLIPTASSPTGQYLGLFQHSAAAWGDRYLEWTRPVWALKPNALNGRTNAVVTMRMVNAEGWGPWAGVGC